mmetsp:Transcript_30396/g.55117  ORF Transcript_30396/g.55117 Transcript_30396/m.55117 type:complete len:110 (+) Transcript_30396:784-1113(+)
MLFGPRDCSGEGAGVGHGNQQLPREERRQKDLRAVGRRGMDNGRVVQRYFDDQWHQTQVPQFSIDSTECLYLRQNSLTSIHEYIVVKNTEKEADLNDMQALRCAYPLTR